MAVLLYIAIFAAWLTHVITCFTHAAYGLLIAGAIFFPVGIVHGICVWIGAGWA
jgi:hypothetical protein